MQNRRRGVQRNDAATKGLTQGQAHEPLAGPQIEDAVLGLGVQELRNGLDPTAIGEVTDIRQHVGEPLPRGQRRSRFSRVAHARALGAADAGSSLLPTHKVRCLTVHSLPVSALDP